METKITAVEAAEIRSALGHDLDLSGVGREEADHCLAWVRERAERDSALRALVEGHFEGIEGGLDGAVADLRAGVSVDAACGLGDSWGELPAGISARNVEDAIRGFARNELARADSEEG